MATFKDLTAIDTAITALLTEIADNFTAELKALVQAHLNTVISPAPAVPVMPPQEALPLAVETTDN